MGYNAELEKLKKEFAERQAKIQAKIDEANEKRVAAFCDGFFTDDVKSYLEDYAVSDMKLVGSQLSSQLKPYLDKAKNDRLKKLAEKKRAAEHDVAVGEIISELEAPVSQGASNFNPSDFTG